MNTIDIQPRELDIGKNIFILLKVGQIYKKYFSNNIINIDNINNIELFLSKIIEFLENAERDLNDEDELVGWEYNLTNANVHLKNHNLKASLDRCAWMILDIIEKENKINFSSIKDVSNMGTEKIWKTIIKYIDEINSSFKFSQKHFNYDTLIKCSGPIGALIKMIKIYGLYFTLRDKNEIGYKDRSNIMYGGKFFKEFNNEIWMISKELDGYYYNELARNIHLKAKKEAIKKQDFKMLIKLIGEQAKLYFLNFYIKNEIISKEYFLYLNGLSCPWDSLKEIYYLTIRNEIADNILKITTKDYITHILKTLPKTYLV